MLKQKIIISLVALMCLSQASGFLTVICHGLDGHTAVELVAHDHCSCPEENQADHQDSFVAQTIHSSTDHEHCRDTVATSGIVTPVRKNVKLSTQKILVSHVSPKLYTADAYYDIGLAAHTNKSFSFYEPLRTIILLA